MIYRKQFQQAIEAHKAIFPNETAPTAPVSIDEPKLPEALLGFARSFVEKVPLEHRVKKCHAVATSFRQALAQTPTPFDIDLAVTIGNVSYGGETLFTAEPVDLASIEKLIAEGPDSTSPMNAHVWLTANNMVVVDLNVAAWLREVKGMDTDGGVVLHHEGDGSGLVYEPLLVDNDFLFRVDRVKETHKLD